ncbi:glycosyl hydrolase, partial [Bacteroidota bacterium]
NSTLLLLFIQSFYWISCSLPADKREITSKELVSGFERPPGEARPGIWWIWINGNISKESITRDLEAMKVKGINTAEIYEAGDPGTRKDFNLPPGLPYLGDESVKRIKHALSEGKRLNMNIGLKSSSGWNAGGTWVTPDWASKALYFTEVEIEGSENAEIDLPFPEVRRNCPKTDKGFPVFYKEVAILAVPFNKNKIYNNNKILNLTSDFINGKLHWKAREGRWTIIRFVCTNTGQLLWVPSPKSRGLYIDFLDPEATKRHYKYILDRLGITPGNTSDIILAFIFEDSMELRLDILWTDLMPKIFKERQGYEIVNYLPVLAGWSIKEKTLTDRFLYDFNKTVSDQIIYSNFKTGYEFLKGYDIELNAEHPCPPMHRGPIDALKALKYTSVPSGEFWIGSRNNLFFVKQAASASHIYGKKLVDAEAFTTWRKWKDAPFDFKKYVDRAYCEGLNTITLNNFTSTSPEYGQPGLAGYAGQDINSANTWWEKSKPFMDYLSRCNYLLRQGFFIGDACYYYGDQAPNFFPSSWKIPEKPMLKGLGKGYDYDIVNSDVILNRMSVKDGRIVLPNGMSYAVMILPEQEHMPLEILKKIIKLVKSGATVIGPKPSTVPNLNNYEKEEIELKKRAAKLWGEIDGKNVMENSYGKGKVFYGLTPEEVLLKKGINKDFNYSGGIQLDYIHRTMDIGDVYFISNRNDSWYNGDCEFRITGKYPELWDPTSGFQRKVTAYNAENDKTSFRLELAPWGSVFVVFVDEKRPDLEPAGIKEIIKSEEIGGTWEVSFPEGWGAPSNALFKELKSWTESDNKGIKYFSGTATYHNTILIDKEMVENNTNIIVDLGEVCDVAEVFINGKSAGIVWKYPYSADITGLVKPGENELKIEVVNCWINRITGDMLSDPEDRYCTTNRPYIKEGRESRPGEAFEIQTSGLLGPVRINYFGVATN